MESCTSGLIASMITDTEGASAIFPGGYVTYLNETKIFVGVDPKVIERYGVYSTECAEAMARRQAAFFTGQTGELRPMSAQELAGELGVHPSTVSRALRGKYLQCVQGVYPLRYFCSPAVSEALSGQAVRRRILDLIREEDPAQPLSDVGLQERLQAEGVSVSRRTVTKYRQSLGIPTFGQRKNAPKRRDTQ